MRKRKRNRNKGQVRLVLGVAFCLLCVMTVGYSAFSTNVSLSAKGNIKEKPASEKIIENEGVQEASSTVDGLYKDTTEDPVDGKYRYVYKGADPDNYFTFNGETAGWRIVSIESDGTIKIVKTASLGNIAWDATNTRSSSTDTYCTYASQYGCNAWAKTSSLASSNSTFSSGLASGTFHQYGTNGGTSGTDYNGKVTKDASLNTYLQDTYYASTLTSTSKQYIDKHDFAVSTPGNNGDTDSVATDVEQEKLYTWNGYVGLINITDYMRTTTNSTCTSINAGYGSSNASVCGTNNWLNNSTSYWTISPYVSTNRYSVFYVNSSGYLYGNIASYTYGVRPAIYLKSGISIKGSGTSGSPYYIDE